MKGSKINAIVGRVFYEDGQTYARLLLKFRVLHGRPQGSTDIDVAISKTEYDCLNQSLEEKKRENRRPYIMANLELKVAGFNIHEDELKSLKACT